MGNKDVDDFESLENKRFMNMVAALTSFTGEWEAVDDLVRTPEFSEFEDCMVRLLRRHDLMDRFASLRPFSKCYMLEKEPH